MRTFKYILGITIFLILSGCAPKALPMTENEVLSITKGDDFTPTYSASFKNVSYECTRMKPEVKKIFAELWNKGTYSSYELYDYKSRGYFGKYAHIKHTASSLNDGYVFEKREDCIRFAAPKGSGSSIDVYVH